jgi:hypothetical protein
MLPPSSVIDNASSLEEVAAFLHDARFTADSISFDADKQIFSLKCWVQLAFRGVYKAYTLSFSGVTGCNVVQEEDVRFYEISTLRFNENSRRLEILTHYAVEISLELVDLMGMLTETSETREW